jgi:hypothetical protein
MMNYWEPCQNEHTREEKKKSEEWETSGHKEILNNKIKLEYSKQSMNYI